MNEEINFQKPITPKIKKTEIIVVNGNFQDESSFRSLPLDVFELYFLDKKCSFIKRNRAKLYYKHNETQGETEINTYYLLHNDVIVDIHRIDSASIKPVPEWLIIDKESDETKE